MLNYLSHLPDIHLFFLLSGVAILFSIIVMFAVRRFVSLELLYKDNSVIGNIGALISIIYGVLAGLMALYLINNVNYTADAVQREANAVANVYRDSTWLAAPMRSQIRDEIKNYLTTVIHVEWPIMEDGKRIDQKGDAIINQIAHQTHQYSLTKNAGQLVLNNMISEISALYDARQQRIHMSYTSLNPEIWLVIFIGTILTIGINYFFGMNFYLHLASISAVALMTASMVFLLIALDRPFQGEFIIEPDAFQSLLTIIEQDSARN